MFHLFKGFRKASNSEFKQLLTDANARLELLKIKRRYSINRTRNEVYQLIKHGDSVAAFDKAGDVYKDEIMIEVYDLLQEYCEVLALNLIFQHKDDVCPDPDEDHIKEAVSTLIYTYMKFDEVPELHSIGVLFGRRYSYEFVNTALKLRPGNHVKFSVQIDEALDMKDVPDYVKIQLLLDIESSMIRISSYEEENEVESSSSCEGESGIESVSSCEGENEIESSTSQVSSCKEEPVLDDVSCDSMQFSDDSSENCEILNFLETYCDEDLALEQET